MNVKKDQETSEEKEPSQTVFPSASKSHGLIKDAVIPAIVGAVTADVYAVFLHPLTLDVLERAHVILDHIHVLSFQPQGMQESKQLKRLAELNSYYLEIAIELNVPISWPEFANLTELDIENIRDQWKSRLKSIDDEGALRSENLRKLLFSLIEKGVIFRNFQENMSEDSGIRLPGRERKRL